MKLFNKLKTLLATMLGRNQTPEPERQQAAPQQREVIMPTPTLITVPPRDRRGVYARRADNVRRQRIARFGSTRHARKVKRQLLATAA